MSLPAEAVSDLGAWGPSAARPRSLGNPLHDAAPPLFRHPGGLSGTGTGTEQPQLRSVEEPSGPSAQSKRNMKTRGSTFRATVTAALELEDADPVWLQLLDETCRALDLVERLEENLSDQTLLVPGSRGQQTPNPLLPELRHQRAAVAKLLSQLGTDSDGETQSQRQRRFAQKRWK